MKQTRKLTMVSVQVGNKHITTFAHAKVADGKAIVSMKFIQQLLDNMNVPRGKTFTIG